MPPSFHRPAHTSDSPRPRAPPNANTAIVPAGFAYEPAETPVYRSARLHDVDPTAAAHDDFSHYWTVDSGRGPGAAARAAEPGAEGEHIRNTRSGAEGGVVARLMRPMR